MSIKEAQILMALQEKVAELERAVKDLQQNPEPPKRGPGRPPKNTNKG